MKVKNEKNHTMCQSKIETLKLYDGSQDTWLCTKVPLRPAVLTPNANMRLKKCIVSWWIYNMESKFIFKVSITIINADVRIWENKTEKGNLYNCTSKN